MKTKNVYTEDLKLAKGERTTIKFSDDSEQFVTSVTILKNDEDMYTIVSATSFDSELQALINRRYNGNFYNNADFDQRLRDMQYEIRKALKSAGAEQEEPEIETPEIKTPEPKAPPKPDRLIIDDAIIEEDEDEEEVPAIGLDAVIAQTIKSHIKGRAGKKAIEVTARQMLKEWGIVPNQVEHIIKKFDGTKIKVGTQHKDFDKILKVVTSRTNLALVGPAGSGKTTTVANVAKALELPFYSKSVSAMTTTHEFFGYQDANGKYVRTLFREAYEKGGVFLVDEFDAGNPNVLASLNQATANGSCAFADGMVEKHPDFICVMAGNTFGHGATSEYVGRNKIDAATLDRFAFIFFDYDENMEYTLAENKAWCKKIQTIRRRVFDKKIKTIISPRATFMGSSLLEAGLDEEDVLQMVVYKGLSQDEVSMLR